MGSIVFLFKYIWRFSFMCLIFPTFMDFSRILKNFKNILLCFLGTEERERILVLIHYDLEPRKA